MAYINIAKEILKENIKSAIYIDENAREFNQDVAALIGADEEILSLELYSKFRSAGVSLESVKYAIGYENDDNWVNYCLDNRDLILLDWHLDGQSGEIQSLIILDKIINTPNIHFCVIYTSEEYLDGVFKRILTNYSSLTKEVYSEYKEYTESIFGEGFDFSEFHKISMGRNDADIKKEIGPLLKKYKTQIEEFKKAASLDDIICAICKISNVNLDTFHEELNHPLPCPNIIKQDKFLLEINNTIITIFKKKENDPKNLLDNFFDHIINDIDSYNQLLAIDFFNRIFKIGIINKDNKINFSKEALLEHRNRLKNEGLDSFYEEFVKELLLEKMNLSLRNTKSALLSDEIFEELYNPAIKAKNEDSHRMNVFYNSFILNKKDSYINFGDVFNFEDADKADKYLICLTPLCDCLRPQEKIKRNYFFAEGEHINLEEALKLGDTAFVSFLPNGKVVRWTDAPQEPSKYVPIYVKPLQYKVLDGKDLINENGVIDLYYLNKEGERKSRPVKYITTIRENYCQRIANHAFSYPLRVGVDFVKI
ncbi:response regulator receiver domain [Aequorivita viscosa]|uniref:Response receiver domain-containing protein n=1 Tax=Aequorivita viscosa TaxID=797419 RepID=A0A1M6P3Z7_9FLAO|nr:response regulator receiver domain [Aequorivita viscosa]SDX51858.1 hypothetical protein SAMN05216556_13913 [Aequorivita viscosa]SHK02630.1 hypothetical protein SAMN04487908_1426 [Aequorivita viscosa]